MEQDWSQFDDKVIGTIEIAPEVIEVIASIAALEIEGVNAMSGGLVGDIREKLGRKNFRKGIRVEMEPHGVRIEVSISIDYKQSIPHVANQLQHNIKRTVERMTSLSVKAIDVYVTNVELPNRK